MCTAPPRAGLGKAGRRAKFFGSSFDNTESSCCCEIIGATELHPAVGYLLSQYWSLCQSPLSTHPIGVGSSCVCVIPLNPSLNNVGSVGSPVPFFEQLA